MKKITALAAALLIISMIASGCGANSLADYKKAADKTAQIEQGQKSGDFTLTMDFNTDGMSLDKINELNYYKNLSGNFKTLYDNSEKKQICRNYLNFGGLGFDFNIYKDGDNMFVKLPVIGKYMELKDMMNQSSSKSGQQFAMLSEDTLKALRGEWVGMLKQEDVFKGKKIVMTTPDGEVKTTLFTITLNEEQLKTFETNVIDILSKDENLRKNYETAVRQYSEKPDVSGFDSTVGKLKSGLSGNNVESFQYTAYVDVDGYIVDEKIDAKLGRKAAEPGETKTVSFHLELKNWDINQAQKFEFPELTGENTVTMDHMSGNIPLLVDFFRQKGSKE